MKRHQCKVNNLSTLYKHFNLIRVGAFKRFWGMINSCSLDLCHVFDIFPRNCCKLSNFQSFAFIKVEGKPNRFASWQVIWNDFCDRECVNCGMQLKVSRINWVTSSYKMYSLLPYLRTRFFSAYK